MKCPECLLPNSAGSLDCSGCGSSLTSKAEQPSKETFESPIKTAGEESKPSANKVGLIVFASVLAIIGIVFINGLNKGVPVASDPTPTQTADPNFYCSSMLRSLNKAVEYMGNAGTLYTIGDVAAVLQDEGDSLRSGYNLQMAGDADRLGWIRNAGSQLLQIRVALIDGGDIDTPIASFSESLNLISASCN